MQGQAIAAIGAKEKVKKEGFNANKALLSAKAIIAEQQEILEALKKELEELKEATCDYAYLSEQYDEHKRQIEECELVPSENVLCSYDDINDFIWARLKDICSEEPNIPDFDWNELIRDFKAKNED